MSTSPIPSNSVYVLLAVQYLANGPGDLATPVAFQRGTPVSKVKDINGDYIQVVTVKDGKQYHGIVRRDKIHKEQVNC